MQILSRMVNRRHVLRYCMLFEKYYVRQLIAYFVCLEDFLVLMLQILCKLYQHTRDAHVLDLFHEEDIARIGCLLTSLWRIFYL